MKFSRITTVAAFLTLSLGVSVQGGLLNVTTLDVPGASGTVAFGIDGDNVVGYYLDANFYTHGFIATIPEPATLSLLTLSTLMLLRRRR